MHAELSPATVIIARDGGVKLTELSATVVDDQVMRPFSGGRRGRMGYAAPEQLRGRAVTTRTDVFSLGLVIAELVLGGPVVSGGQLDLETLGDEIESRCAERADVPTALIQLLVQMTRSNAAERPRSAQDVVRLLARISEGLGGLPRLDAELATVFARAAPVVTEQGLMATPSEPKAPVVVRRSGRVKRTRVPMRKSRKPRRPKMDLVVDSIRRSTSAPAWADAEVSETRAVTARPKPRALWLAQVLLLISMLGVVGLLAIVLD